MGKAGRRQEGTVSVLGKTGRARLGRERSWRAIFGKKPLGLSRGSSPALNKSPGCILNGTELCKDPAVTVRALRFSCGKKALE